MDLQSLLNKLDISDFIQISDTQLVELIESLKMVFEEDSMISGFIRIFEVNSLFIFQEQTPKDEILIRIFNNETEADNLIQNRLDIYEKMWNGCGCRIDYFSG
jgi:hypothetical protein